VTGAALEEDEPLDEPEDELGLEAVVGVRVICPGQTTGGGTYRVVVTVTGFIGVAGIERGMTGYGAELRGDVPVETGVAGDTVGATTGVARGAEMVPRRFCSMVGVASRSARGDVSETALTGLPKT
jgi:hypothetical protein